MAKPLLRRVSHKIRYNDPSGCWIWTGYILPTGYGQADRNTAMHRYMFEQVVGPIPAGKQLDHICRTRNCVNPEHLEPVDLATNVLRGESPAALKALQTHCDRGHELTPENTYVAPGKKESSRECFTCRKRRTREWAAKQSPEWRAERAEYGRNYRLRKKLESLERQAPPPVVTQALICGVPCLYGGAKAGKPRYKAEVEAPGRCNRPVDAVGERCWQHR